MAQIVNLDNASALVKSLPSKPEIEGITNTEKSAQSIEKQLTELLSKKLFTPPPPQII